LLENTSVYNNLLNCMESDAKFERGVDYICTLVLV
jgi:hypothetical protein